MARPISFVHLTDLHIGNPEKEDRWLLSDTTSKLRSLLRQIKALNPQPSFVVVTGDLTNTGEDGSYHQLSRILTEENVAIPMLFALGNHDSREGLYRIMLGRTDDLSAPYSHAQVIAGVHVIVLDSTTPGSIGGLFEPEQFGWLANELDRHADLPKLIAMHHPPAFEEDDRDPANEWMTLPLPDSARLRETLRGHNIVGILCGHIHHDRISNWHGIPVAVGIGNHFALDVAFLPHGQRMLAASSFAIGHIRPSGLTISYVAQPSDLSELYKVTNAQWEAVAGNLDNVSEPSE